MKTLQTINKIILSAAIILAIVSPVKAQDKPVKKKPTPKYLDTKILKADFSTAPFNFIFKDPKAVDKTESLNGTEVVEKSATAIQPGEVEIQYDPADGEIYQSTITLYSATVNVQTEKLEKLYKFAGYFDPRAEKFFRKNFAKIFFDEVSYREGINFKSRNKNLKFTFKHDLFSIREIIAKEGEKAMEGRNVIISLQVSNQRKHILN